MDCPALDSYADRHVISEEFYGTTWSSSGFSWVGPDTMEIFVNEPEGLKVTSYPEGSPVEGKLYDFSFLEKKDKYSTFMGGNCPLHEIVTGNEGKPSLLIIRDSFTDQPPPSPARRLFRDTCPRPALLPRQPQIVHRAERF
ncbi:MAG: hypothetical protein ACLTSG_07715 [Lachnospiraceae bacterium]